MSGAAATIATPAPAAEPAPLIGLEEALDAAQPPSDEPAEAAAAGDEPAPTEAKPAPGAALDPLSEEALKAPDGIKKAREFLKEKERAHDRQFLKLRDREDKLKGTLEKWKTERGQEQAFLQSVQADLKLLQNGSAEQKLDALGRLSRKDGLKIWEEMAISAAQNGKRPPISPELIALREELAELKGSIVGERKQQQDAAQSQAEQRQLHQLKQQLVQGASDAATYPALAHFAGSKPAEVAEHLTEMIQTAHEAGRPITWQQAFVELNSELSKYHTEATASVAARAADGLATVAAPAAKPVIPTQRTPGRSLNPGLATRTAGVVREMTDQERLAELANDSAFISSLFG